MIDGPGSTGYKSLRLHQDLGHVLGRALSRMGDSMRNTAINGTMLQGFSWNLPPDGQHWRRLANYAPSFAQQGITSIWMPPAYKGQAGANDVGYGVYDMWDLGEFDQRGSVTTKYGSRREYVAAVRVLQNAGIDVLGDVVLNHRMGSDANEEVLATPVDPANRMEPTGEPETIQAATRFTFPGRAGRLDKFTWDHTCFKGVDYDAATQRNGVWLLDGKSWDDDVDKENGNYDYLMGADVDVNDPKVFRQIETWGKWYLRVTHVDGLRLDAVKHISRQFYLRFLADMRKATGKELFCVGEYWSPSLDALTAYLGEEQAMSLFDVPLHFNFYRASIDLQNTDLSHILDGSLVGADPVHAVTFVDNHDTQPKQALASTVEPWFKPMAYALILLREAGYPCVFFSDLYGLANDAIPAVTELPLLMEIRRRYSYGLQRDYFDDPNIVGWTREGDRKHTPGVAVVLSKGQVAHKHMCVGEAHAGQTWRCVLGDEGSVTIGEDGFADFPSNGETLTVYLADEAASKLDHIPIVVPRA